jgi:hypothetical protein
MTRPNVRFSNLSALYLHKRAELSQPVKCHCLSSIEALVSMGLFVLVLGMLLGVWMCQTIGR